MNSLIKKDGRDFDAKMVFLNILVFVFLKKYIQIIFFYFIKFIFDINILKKFINIKKLRPQFQISITSKTFVSRLELFKCVLKEK